MDERPTHLDLFSGIGGFALAAQWAGFRTIGFCEIDKYCRKVLAKNFMADTTSGNGRGRSTQGWIQETVGTGSETPVIHSDIFSLDGRDFAGVSLITGGFPCQPFSVAGKRGGAADDRAIWPQMFRVISEARPSWVLGENVPGIIQMELDNVLSDLEGIGYACRPFVIPACAVDARHRRDRLWIIGRNVSDAQRERGCSGNSERQDAEDVGQRSESEGMVANSDWRRCEQRDTGQWRVSELNPCCWKPEPAVRELADGVSDGLVRYAGRVATKVPNRVQKLKGLGNAIVPQVAYEILREIRKLI